MNRFVIKYLLLFLAQAALWNYFDFSQYVILVFLPAMILCLPADRGSVFAMVVAFVTGLGLDFIVTGQLGMCSLALVPAGLLRRTVLRIAFGPEMLSRGESLSFQRQGWQKFLLAIFLLTAVFLLIYIPVDSAGMRPFWLDLVRLAASLALSVPVSVPIAYLLLEETGERWK